jgi:hypothetical protein
MPEEEAAKYRSMSPPKYITAHWDSGGWQHHFVELQNQVNELKMQIKDLHKIINNMENKHE